MNCRFYDETAYNECSEPSAERVVDKEKSNFCDYFSPPETAAGSGTAAATRGGSSSTSGGDSALSELDRLFKG